MRHLKSYQLFELTKFQLFKDSELKEMVQTCRDILVELEDRGFNYNLQFYYNPWITFHIVRKEEFDYSDIEDVVERLKGYLQNFNLYLSWQSSDEAKLERPTIKTTGVMNPMTFTPDGMRTHCELHFKEL